MNPTINCEAAQRAIESAFDNGVALPSEVAAHAATCRACRAYGESLTALDLGLRLAPPVQPAHALVARIQAEIATQPRHRLRPWAYPVGVAAVILLLASLGPVVNGTSSSPVVEFAAWIPDEPIVPEWGFLRQELTSIPVGFASDLVALGEWSEMAWASLNGWLAGVARAYSPWVWLLFLPCVAAACALDGIEWMSRRVQRSGH